MQDSDIYRICVDSIRPSMAERAQGKIPPGIYLRDIAEIREGAESFQFTENKVPPRDINNCLSLVGSERTISLELPSKVQLTHFSVFDIVRRTILTFSFVV